MYMFLNPSLTPVMLTEYLIISDVVLLMGPFIIHVLNADHHISVLFSLAPVISAFSLF